MNATPALSGTPISESAFSVGSTPPAAYSKITTRGRTQVQIELVVFSVLLAIANLPLLGDAWRGHLAFFPQAVAHGEWWRVITHPFVHVSWYHLLLDGVAFFMLYAELGHWHRWRRLATVGASALTSTLAALVSPITWAAGFGGLSGAAHGLMAVSALEMIRRGATWERVAGWCALAAVLGKASFEAVTGQVALSWLHFGLMGVPVAVCHAGGVIGGLVAFACLRPKL